MLPDHQHWRHSTHVSQVKSQIQAPWKTAYLRSAHSLQRKSRQVLLDSHWDSSSLSSSLTHQAIQLGTWFLNSRRPLSTSIDSCYTRRVLTKMASFHTKTLTTAAHWMTIGSQIPKTSISQSSNPRDKVDIYQSHRKWWSSTRSMTRVTVYCCRSTGVARKARGITWVRAVMIVETSRNCRLTKIWIIRRCRF